MILSKQKCCLLLTSVSTESQNVPLYFKQSGLFTNKKHDSCKWWTCSEFCRTFTFRTENIYVEFKGIIYQHIVGIHMGTNRALLIADLVLFCYEKNCMSNLYKFI